MAALVTDETLLDTTDAALVAFDARADAALKARIVELYILEAKAMAVNARSSAAAKAPVPMPYLLTEVVKSLDASGCPPPEFDKCRGASPPTSTELKPESITPSIVDEIPLGDS
jgi:hypothetical protein